MNDSEEQHETANDSERQPTADGERRRRRRWPRWLAMVLLGLVILGSGIVIGSVGTLVTIKHGMMRAVQYPEQIPERTVQRMARRYDLTDEQRAEVEAILTGRLQRMAEIRRRIRPHIDEQLDSLREDVAQVLTEEQEAQWREDFSRLRKAVQVPMHAPASPDAPEGSASPPG
ncbi:MAG: hypothetical protein GF393_03840 [Armatimonadia bacterium]|nr:hypothetical protein [Armatimonadia bacterium]